MDIDLQQCLVAIDVALMLLSTGLTLELFRLRRGIGKPRPPQEEATGPGERKFDARPRDKSGRFLPMPPSRTALTLGIVLILLQGGRILLAYQVEQSESRVEAIRLERDMAQERFMSESYFMQQKGESLRSAAGIHVNSLEAIAKLVEDRLPQPQQFIVRSSGENCKEYADEIGAFYRNLTRNLWGVKLTEPAPTSILGKVEGLGVKLSAESHRILEERIAFIDENLARDWSKFQGTVEPDLDIMVRTCRAVQTLPHIFKIRVSDAVETLASDYQNQSAQLAQKAYRLAGGSAGGSPP